MDALTTSASILARARSIFSGDDPILLDQYAAARDFIVETLNDHWQEAYLAGYDNGRADMFDTLTRETKDAK